MNQRSRPARGSDFRIPLLLLLCLPGGCLPPKLPPPVRVAPAQLASVSSLCLLPLDSDAPATPETAKELENQIAVALRMRGFGSVDSEKTTEALGRLGLAAGGYYDVDTGQRDEERYARLGPKVRSGVGQALGCQALLEPRVLFVVAPWDGGTARWDGNQMGIGGGSGAYGTIGALSLHLRITDADDREIFYGTGGIQPTGRLNEGWFDSKFEDVDPDSLLRNVEANREAIDIALKDLPGRVKRTPAQAAPERR